MTGIHASDCAEAPPPTAFQVLGLLPIYYVIGTYVLNVFSLGDSLFLGGRWRIDDVHLEFPVTADRMKM